MKNFRIPLLMDVYGSLLTDKQRDAMELYYDEDYSLSEIAEHEKITRQGVRDNIRRGEQVLLDAEERLGLCDKLIRQGEALKEIAAYANEIYKESALYGYQRTITERAKAIAELAEKNIDMD